MADDMIDDAIGTVALRAMANALRREFVDDNGGWREAYPGVTEQDWEAVIERIQNYVAELDPSKAMFDAAYRLLGARVDAV